jgi:hypothetical protein
MKKIFWVNLILICFVFVSCATTKIAYDELVLGSDIAQIMPSADIGIDEFNGKSVHWYAGFWSATEISIPSGEAELVLSLRDVQRGSVLYYGGALVVKYNFEKGHNYFIRINEIISSTEVIFTINDKTTKINTDVNAKAKKNETDNNER